MNFAVQLWSCLTRRAERLERQSAPSCVNRVPDVAAVTLCLKQKGVSPGTATASQSAGSNKLRSINAKPTSSHSRGRLISPVDKLPVSNGREAARVAKPGLSAGDLSAWRNARRVRGNASRSLASHNVGEVGLFYVAATPNVNAGSSPAALTPFSRSLVLSRGHPKLYEPDATKHLRWIIVQTCPNVGTG